MAAAVTAWSPVIIFTRMPARRHRAIASRASGRGGSTRPTRPTSSRSWSASASAAPWDTGYGTVRLAAASTRRPRLARASWAALIAACASASSGVPSGPVLQRASTASGAPFTTTRVPAPPGSGWAVAMYLWDESNGTSAPRGAASRHARTTAELPARPSSATSVGSPIAPGPAGSPPGSGRASLARTIARARRSLAGSAAGSGGTGRSACPVHSSVAVIWFNVSVPVLSLQMTVVDPRVSTEASCLTIALRFAIRCAPTARVTVTTAGRPSGIAATASATASSSTSSHASPWARPRTITASTATPATAASRCPRRWSCPCSGVLERGRVAQERGERADLGLHAGCGHDGLGPPTGDDRLHEEAVGTVADGRVGGGDPLERLAHRERLAGERGLVDLEVVGHDERRVGGDAVPGLQEHDVTRHQCVGRELHHRATAPDAGRVGEHRAEGVEALLRSTLLHEAEQGVGDHHDPDDDRVLQIAHCGGEHRRTDQDQDEEAAELVEEPQERGSGDGRDEPVRPVGGEEALGFGRGQADRRVDVDGGTGGEGHDGSVVFGAEGLSRRSHRVRCGRPVVSGPGWAGSVMTAPPRGDTPPRCWI